MCNTSSTPARPHLPPAVPSPACLYQEFVSTNLNFPHRCPRVSMTSSFISHNSAGQNHLFIILPLIITLRYREFALRISGSSPPLFSLYFLLSGFFSFSSFLSFVSFSLVFPCLSFLSLCPFSSHILPSFPLPSATPSLPPYILLSFLSLSFYFLSFHTFPCLFFHSLSFLPSFHPSLSS